jgi:hypothetical protein
MTCSVQGFHKSFEPIPEVSVATVATAWDDQNTGQTYILIIHQAPYFGNQLDHSSINPNQIRVTGIPVCDDPYNRYRYLGIDMGDIEEILGESERGTQWWRREQEWWQPRRRRR